MKKEIFLQVNLCQKVFLHQLTHNMTTDCSLNYQFSTWKYQAQNTLRTYFEHNFFFGHSEQFVYTTFWDWNFHELNWYFKGQSFVILWVRWSKNKRFWQKLTCILIILISGLIMSKAVEKSGVHKRLCFWILRRTENNPYKQLFAFMSLAGVYFVC